MGSANCGAGPAHGGEAGARRGRGGQGVRAQAWGCECLWGGGGGGVSFAPGGGRARGTRARGGAGGGGGRVWERAPATAACGLWHVACGDRGGGSVDGR